MAAMACRLCVARNQAQRVTGWAAAPEAGGSGTSITCVVPSTPGKPRNTASTSAGLSCGNAGSRVLATALDSNTVRGGAPAAGKASMIDSRSVWTETGKSIGAAYAGPPHPLEYAGHR